MENMCNDTCQVQLLPQLMGHMSFSGLRFARELQRRPVLVIRLFTMPLELCHECCRFISLAKQYSG